MNIFQYILHSPYFVDGLDIAIIVLTLSVIYWLASRVLDSVTHARTRYSLKRFVRAILVIIGFVLVISLFIRQTTILIASVGLLSAGLSFSLRDPITSIFEYFVIMIFKPVKVGDRVKVQNEEGDIIDINAFFITLMEIKQWTDGDLYTGRIVEVPNNILMSSELINFSKGFNFLWDNITIPIYYDENWKEVIDIARGVAHDVTERFFEQAREEYEALKKNYLIERGTFEPQVFVSFTDNYIKLNLRYMTELWSRKRTESEISSRILEEFGRRGIEVASSSIVVQNRNAAVPEGKVA